MHRSTAVFVVFAAFACANGQELSSIPAPGGSTPTMASNLRYRTSWGDLGKLVGAPPEKLRSLRLEQGGDELLAACLADPQKWRRDPLIFRFAHSHPLTTIGCRERAPYGMHVVFYKMADGSRQAWIHFDLSRPGNLVGHSVEVVQNRLTLGHTSQTAVYRGLLKRHGADAALMPEPAYDLHAEMRAYEASTFAVAPIGSAAAFGSVGSFLDPTHVFGEGFEHFSNHVEADLIRNTLRQTIEFGAGALLKQDEKFAVSDQTGIRRRARAALYHAFFVPGRSGDEFAFPRLAAALGTTWITEEWHPWRSNEPNFEHGVGEMLSLYVMKSFWAEFKPDVKSRMQTGERRLMRRDQDPLLADPGVTSRVR